MQSDIIIDLGITLMLGLLVGFQREIYYMRYQRKEFAGTRTFALISLLGYLSAWLGSKIDNFTIILTIGFLLLVIVAYAYKIFFSTAKGATSEIAAIITFILGIMVYEKLNDYAIFIAIVMVALLEFKSKFLLFEKYVQPQDSQAAILFLAMTFVILPLLPNKTVDPFGVFNPYQTWLMVVLVAGISFIGYIAIKILGTKRGVYLTGVFGGLVSSTAVSITLSKLYALKQSHIKNYAGGIAIASTFMYLRVLFEASVFNFSLAKELALPYLGAAVIGFIYTFYLYKTSFVHEVEESSIRNNPLELSEALKLGLLFGLILGSIGFFQERYGDAGVYAVSALSGLTDVDAITLSLSKLAKTKIDELTAIYGIVTASSVNSMVKLGIVFVLGGKKLGGYLAIFYLCTIGTMVAMLFIL